MRVNGTDLGPRTVARHGVFGTEYLYYLIDKETRKNDNVVKLI